MISPSPRSRATSRFYASEHASDQIRAGDPGLLLRLWPLAGAGAGDTPATVTVSTSPPGLVTFRQPVAEPHPTAWFSGAAAGTEYVVPWTMTTATGRIKTEAVSLVVG